MELVPIINKFLLICGGLMLVVIISSFLASKIDKKRNTNSIEHYKSRMNSKNLNTRKDKLPVKNTQQSSNFRADNNPEIKEVRVIRKLNEENFHRPTHQSTKANTRDHKERYSIVNDKYMNEKKSGNKSVTENDFRIFNPQNNSNSGRV